MAYTKAELLQISGQLERAYVNGERTMLERIIEADLTDYQRARAEQQLRQIREALDNLRNDTDRWVNTHVPRLYIEGMAEADVDLNAAQQALQPPDELAALHTTSIETYGEQMRTKLGEARVLVGRRVDDLFRQAALASLQESTILGETPKKAIKRMIADMQSIGITSFTDQAGRRWGLARYAEMVTRTTTREATDAGLFNRLAERGHDLIKVTTHSGACDKCLNAIAMHGLIYSLSGNSDEYPSYDQGKAAGLWHPQCVHRPTTYIERYQQASEKRKERLARAREKLREQAA